MSKTYLGKRIQSFESSPQFDAYSRVEIIVSEDLTYTAGTDTGRTLTLENPWGTQAMANNILAKIKGFRYKPYTADGALLDPSVELGDGVTVNGLYSGIYAVETQYGKLLRAKVSAPAEDELESEYPYVSKSERKILRKISGVSAELSVQADKITAVVTDIEGLSAELSVQAGKIDAQVEAREGDEQSAFGWELLKDSWTIRANGTPVLTAKASGLEVYGKITATSGKIGGFDIESNYLSYNNLTWGGSGYGGYIGQYGIQLGSNFKVDMSGNLEAYNGKFTGYVTAGKVLHGTDTETGEVYGTLSGTALTTGSVYGGYNGVIGASTLSTYNTTSGINTSLGYADYANGVFNGINNANFVDGKLFLDGYRLYRMTIPINGEQVRLIAWVSTEEA